jgi:hypothetical protein
MEDDWSKIVPLTEKEALVAVISHFTECKLNPDRIDHKNNKQGEESPDLIIKKDGVNLLLCEVKTPGHYIDPVLRMYLWKNVYGRLRDRLRKARKQFESYDPKHQLPRVVVFTSNHPQLNYTHCRSNIIGAMVVGNKILQDFRNLPEFKYAEKNIRNVDMILWCQVNRMNKVIFETEHFINGKSKYLETIKQISDILLVKRRYVFEY